MTGIMVMLLLSCSRHITPAYDNSTEPGMPVIIHDSVTTSSAINSSITDLPGKPDSASIEALLKCDSLGNVYLKTITQLQGEVVKQSVKLQANELTIKAISATREKKQSVKKDSIITITNEVPVPYPVEKVIHTLTSWQSFQIWIGRIVLIALLIYLAIKIAAGKLSFITTLFKKL